MANEFQNLYYGGLHKTNLHPKKGIFLDNMEEKILGFYAKVTATEWMCFTPNPCYDNEHWVREFYTKHSIVFLQT